MQLKINLDCIETILELTTEYQADWIRTAIDCSMQYVKVAEVSKNNQESIIKLLHLANEYQLCNVVYIIAKYENYTA